MANLIIPACGQSTRFPGLRPKWLLTHPNGNPMFLEAANKIDYHFDNIYLVVLQEHIDKYKFRMPVKANHYSIISLPTQTISQCDTIYQALKYIPNKPFFVKDCDNTFRFANLDESCSAVSVVPTSKVLNNSGKSYAEIAQGRVHKMYEKSKTTAYMSCGGYFFNDARLYNEIYEKNQPEYLSQVINELIELNRTVVSIKCYDYEDWGTARDWNLVKERYKTYFVDLDGVLFNTNGGDYFGDGWEQSNPNYANISFLQNLPKETYIIITTSRPSHTRRNTESELRKYKVRYNQIIFDLPSSTHRVIINDYADSNPNPSCSAISIQRNSSGVK